MCAHVEVSEIDAARFDRIREILDEFAVEDEKPREIINGNIGEPQKHVEYEPMPEAAPVEAPAVVPAAEPVPA